MDQAEAALIATAITATVSFLVFGASHILTSRREDRTRRLEAALRYSERQIEELYGPLLSLIDQVFAIHSTRERLLLPASQGRPVTQERKQQIDFIEAEFFFPKHERIHELLAKNMHLVDGGIVPNSFHEYLEHSMQQLIQYRMARDIGVSTPEVPVIRWPEEFQHDVKTSTNEIRARADGYLRNLEPSGVYRRREPANPRPTP